jgi:protein-S-isoprenylcysteine O-methyltransferase Ste14
MKDTKAFLWISHSPLRLYLVAFFLGMFVDLVTPFGFFSYWLQFALGMPLLCGGIALTVWASEAGKSKPATPEPSEQDFNEAAKTKLVTSGPYKYLRHPYYMSLTLCYAGVAVMFVWPATLLLLLPVLLVLDDKIVPREEAEMERLYGDKWRSYAAAVTRWGYKSKANA